MKNITYFREFFSSHTCAVVSLHYGIYIYYEIKNISIKKK